MEILKILFFKEIKKSDGIKHNNIKNGLRRILTSSFSISVDHDDKNNDNNNSDT